MNLAGQLLDGKYRMVERIGGGGFAVVYKAVHLQLQQEVAVKILISGPTQRFEQEGQAIARLRHPNIVTVYDAGRVGKINYLVMEHMSGGTLADLLMREGPLSLERTIWVITQLADALDYAHARGMVHRDVKPANVLFDADGYLKLSDFGLVKTETSGISLITEVGHAFGTPSYMAPEQIYKQPVGPWTDIYALGIVTYQLVTGHLPFQGSITDILLGHVRDQPPSPGQFRPGLSPEVDQVILQALQKDPQQRYAHAGAFVAALERASQHKPTVSDLSTTVASDISISISKLLSWQNTQPSAQTYIQMHARRTLWTTFVLLTVVLSLILALSGMHVGF